jgi:RNA polymerase sigma factor (sigma-70 family)
VSEAIVEGDGDMGIGSRPAGSRELEALFEGGAAGQKSDGQLLERFLSRGDGLAFEVLVSRHGPMVLRTCRRVLRDEHDAEDAFQATFLVLARKAAAVRGRDSVAPWLRAVAARVATKARAGDDRRKSRARRYEAARVAEVPEGPGPDPERRELALLIREEIDRLPEAYREPVVLCYLDGLSCERAARRLRRPVGTITVQLARARHRLRDRLSRRGVAVPAGLFGLSLAAAADAAQAAVPRALVASTIRAATPFAAGRAAVAGGVPARVAALAEGVLNAMLATRLKLAAALALAALAAGAGLSARSATSAAPAAGRDDPGPVPVARDEPKKAKSDKERLQGRWPALSLEGANGKVEGKGSEADRFKLVFDGDDYVFEGAFGTMGGDAKGTFKLDPKKTPKEIDLESQQGRMVGIYELDGDTLKLCLNKVGVAERPTEFTADETRFVYVFKRAKD